MTAKANKNQIDRRFCSAPLMDWSDRFCRRFWRIISPHTHLYTEMVTTGAIIHGDRDRFLQFDPSEHTVALQLGGSDAKDLAQCAKYAEQWGYDEVNLNVGCPSDRVQNGMIGAILMQHPHVVADGVKAMLDACNIDVTVKHRIGVDEMDDYSGLRDFVGTVAEVGINTFIVHARKAWLSGLSPKQNREIPPLNYELVYQLKQEFPHLEIIINGGINSIEDCQQHLQKVDGVMLGREIYQNPIILQQAEADIFGNTSKPLTRRQILEAYLPFVREEITRGTYLNHMTRHILGLYHGMPGGKVFRRVLSERAYKKDSSAELILEAIAAVEQAAQSTRAKQSS